MLFRSYRFSSLSQSCIDHDIIKFWHICSFDVLRNDHIRESGVEHSSEP